MNHCVECRYWEEPDLPTPEGLGVCLKKTCDEQGKIISTRGDDSCDKFRPLTVDNLLQTRESHRQ